MQLIKLILISMAIMFWAKSQPNKNDQEAFFICYGKVSAQSIEGFSLAILESAHYTQTEITKLKTKNNKLFAYLSLTEVNVNSSLFKELKPFCYQRTENWDSYVISIESEEVQDIIIRYAKSILEKGFDGLFLDNLDNTNKWGVLPHQKKNLENLIFRLKEVIGEHMLIQNAGLHLDDQIQKLSDYLLVESIITDYDFFQKEYRLRPQDSYKNRKHEVEKLQKMYHKKLLIVEYADNDELKWMIQKKMNDFEASFFVTTINLQETPKQ